MQRIEKFLPSLTHGHLPGAIVGQLLQGVHRSPQCTSSFTVKSNQTTICSSEDSSRYEAVERSSDIQSEPGSRRSCILGLRSELWESASENSSTQKTVLPHSTAHHRRGATSRAGCLKTFDARSGPVNHHEIAFVLYCHVGANSDHYTEGSKPTSWGASAFSAQQLFTALTPIAFTHAERCFTSTFDPLRMLPVPFGTSAPLFIDDSGLDKESLYHRCHVIQRSPQRGLHQL